MGTRSDFYIESGDQLEWLGSQAWDGYPSGIDNEVLVAANQEGYRSAVARFLASSESGSMPSDGWPWPWDTSGTTDYAYVFRAEKVWASCFGGPYFDPLVEQKDGEDQGDPLCNPDGPRPTFPDMSVLKRRSVFGKHSGVIVLG